MFAVPNLEALTGRFEFRDFRHFLEVWVWKNQFLREYEDFEFFAEEVARDLAGQNIRYVEAFYSPGDYLSRDMDPARLTEAIRAGLDRVEDIEVALVADLIPDLGLRTTMHAGEAAGPESIWGAVRSLSAARKSRS